MTTRKQIRDTVAQLLEPALLAHNSNLQIFTFKKSKPDRDDAFVCVYLEEAEIENGIGVREDLSQMTVHVLIPDRDEVDDDLDEIGDLCTETLDDNYLLGGLVTEQLPIAWKYERELIPGWVGLTLTYQINW